MSSTTYSRAPYVIDQVWSMISEIGLSRTPFESHMTKIENSLKADLKLYHDTIVKSDIYKSELQTLQLRFGESTKTRDKLERDVERKSEEYNHVLDQLNEALKQKKDLEIKNQSVFPSEIKDALEIEVLQLKLKIQDLTDINSSLILKLDDFSKQIKLLESENQRFQGKLDSINLARKLSDDIFIKATSLGSGKIDTNYRPGLGRESFEIEQAKQETRTNSENSESTLTDPSTSVNEENSDDETVINCNPDDTDFRVSKRFFTNRSSTHQIQITNQNSKLKGFLNKANSFYEKGSTTKPIALQKKQGKPKVFKQTQKKPLKPASLPQKQKYFQNHPHPKNKERLSDKSLHKGYLSHNQKSFQMTGFQKQILNWENLISQIKPQPLRPINRNHNNFKSPKTINKSGPTMVWVPKLSV
ncbi:hypothetical protein L2E82_08486 [Cichorium intybus]|uniref:Uncharacterized protein n=1 Tax=Cichorium intybus TaxID=13427 RepID=A0ACB9G6K6_CICIN|nr:hypothetical protein L2E82_08486 [Cichorium intybus]